MPQYIVFIEIFDAQEKVPRCIKNEMMQCIERDLVNTVCIDDDQKNSDTELDSTSEDSEEEKDVVKWKPFRFNKHIFCTDTEINASDMSSMTSDVIKKAFKNAMKSKNLLKNSCRLNVMYARLL